MKNTWNKISKKMPVSGERVLILIQADTFDMKGYMEVGYYDASLSLFKCSWNAESIINPVAWQELPTTKLK